MFTFLGLLSKSHVETALHISEGFLLLCGLVLLIGIWGEYRKDEKWKKYLAAFQIMVLAGIGGELLADAGVFVFSERLQSLEGADIQALDIKARDASERADAALGKLQAALDRAAAADIASKAAVDKSGKAARSASGALNLAKGARQEADSFEKDIVSARTQAAEAEAHLEEARKRAADTSAELERIKAPRSLTNTSALVDSLMPFKGTEFMFASVYFDDESLRLLRQIDSVLEQAGWKRQRHPGMNLGIPAIQITGRDDLVDTDISTDLHIDVESMVPLETLKARTRDNWPVQVRLAVLLNESLHAHLSPPEPLTPENVVGVVSGSSAVIRIRVGKKP